MNENFITDGGYRFQIVELHDNSDMNWAFLPGGPGLGSEYFMPLISKAKLPGKIWCLDFPGDGSNILNNYDDYSSWSKDLVPALSSFQNVILVTHSFSGMFVLTIPELEKSLKALVIMDASPNKDWKTGLTERAKKHNIYDTSSIKELYNRNKNNKNLKTFTIANWRYFMNEDSKEQAISILRNLPYNYRTYEWADKNFHPTFNFTWVPQHLQTLILAGSDDVITPLSLFKDDSKFNRNNIHFKEIKNASHFPWVEKPDVVTRELINFYDFYVKV